MSRISEVTGEKENTTTMPADEPVRGTRGERGEATRRVVLLVVRIRFCKEFMISEWSSNIRETIITPLHSRIISSIGNVINRASRR
jgi:hypothetical protein